MDREALILELKRLIIQELDIRHRSESDILDDQPLFGAGLGLDSLDALQIAMAIEERYHVTIPEGEAAKHIFSSLVALAEHIEKSQTA